MKKSLLFLFAMLVCMSATAERRTAEQAQDIARSVMKSAKRTRCMPSRQVLKLQEKQQEESFYVISAEGQDGFVIVSADTQMPTVLGISDKPFSTDMPDVVRELLNSYNESYKRLVEGGETAEEIFGVYKKPQDYPDKVEALLGDIEFDQLTPFNNLCPAVGNIHCYTGCVATAISQIMAYYKYPSVGKGNFHFGVEDTSQTYDIDISTLPFDWTKIRHQYVYGKYTEEEATAVARLLYACGAALSMDYGFTGSGAQSDNVKSTLVNSFGYKPDAVYIEQSGDDRPYFDWIPTLQEEFIAGRPVYFAGRRSSVSGHAFVIDGYQGNYTGDDFLNNYEWVRAVLFHVNWGWGGANNGYFYLNSLQPDKSQDNYGAYNNAFVFKIMPGASTPVEETLQTMNGGAIFDIMGRVVSAEHLQAGQLYIQDGKKFIYAQ